jgi:soluble lytic murein transglycosylase-like protein
MRLLAQLVCWLLLGGAPLRASAQSAARGSIAVATAASSELADKGAAFEAHLVSAARRYQLPVAFLRAVARVESGFNPSAISPKGAQGIMQLMPRTARAMGVRNPHDPRQNIFGGARYLRLLANRWRGDLVLTIASYNAGPEAVAKHRGIPPFAETRRYVERVMRHYEAYTRNRVLAHR